MLLTAKATHEQLKRHNRQLLLRAVVSGLAKSRASLAQFTGLAKPTVSDLIAELMNEGFLVEGEFGEAGEAGGKRPRLLEFVPNARQIIGVSISADGVTALLSNLAGEISAAHHAELRGATGDAAMRILQNAINGLVAQLDAPLLCVGVGVAGIIDAPRGQVIESGTLGWQERAITEPLEAALGAPVYIGNTTELATRAQTASLDSPQRLVSLLIDGGVEIGMVLDSAHSFGSDIGGLMPFSKDVHSLASLMNFAPLATTYMPDHITVGYRARCGDEEAQRIITQQAETLSQALKWVIGLLRPDHITLVGPIADYGATFVDELRRVLKKQLPAGWLEAVTLSLVPVDHLSANGAVALAIEKELGIS